MKRRILRGYSRPIGKAKLNRLLNLCREGSLTDRARCNIAFDRWIRNASGSIEDAPVDVEVGSLLKAESDLNLERIRSLLERRPVLE